MFTSADHCNIKNRSSSNKLLGPKLWNKLPIETRTSTNPNSFKHQVKMYFFKALDKENDDCFVYY